MLTLIDRMLLDRLQRNAFQFFECYSDPHTGLVADVGLPGSPSSIAATGFAVSCYPIAVQHRWWTRDEAVARTLKLLRFLAECDQRSHVDATGHRGFYYHFLDMTTGRRTWDAELSTIDTAILFCGLLTAASFFSSHNAPEQEIRDLVRFLYDRVEWDWALDGNQCLSMGWRPETGFLPYSWRGYDESLPLYLLALGSFTYPIGRPSRDAWGSTFSWTGSSDAPLLHAGPLFIHLFPQAWLDLRDIHDPLFGDRDTDYFRNTQRAILQQIGYARENPLGFAGYSANLWGLTAADGARRINRVNGRKVRFLGYVARAVPYGPDDGTIAPWAPLACLPFLPAESLRSLHHLLEHYGDMLIDGRFPEALNATLFDRKGRSRWRSSRVLGIDQGLVVMMIENFRSGLNWELTKGIEPIRNGMVKAGMQGSWCSSGTSAQDAA